MTEQHLTTCGTPSPDDEQGTLPTTPIENQWLERGRALLDSILSKSPELDLASEEDQRVLSLRLVAQAQNLEANSPARHDLIFAEMERVTAVNFTPSSGFLPLLRELLRTTPSSAVISQVIGWIGENLSRVLAQGPNDCGSRRPSGFLDAAVRELENRNDCTSAAELTSMLERLSACPWAVSPQSLASCLILGAQQIEHGDIVLAKRLLDAAELQLESVPPHSGLELQRRKIAALGALCALFSGDLETPRKLSTPLPEPADQDHWSSICAIARECADARAQELEGRITKPTLPAINREALLFCKLAGERFLSREADLPRALSAIQNTSALFAIAHQQGLPASPGHMRTVSRYLVDALTTEAHEKRTGEIPLSLALSASASAHLRGDRNWLVFNARCALLGVVNYCPSARLYGHEELPSLSFLHRVALEHSLQDLESYLTAALPTTSEKARSQEGRQLAALLGTLNQLAGVLTALSDGDGAERAKNIFYATHHLARKLGAEIEPQQSTDFALAQHERGYTQAAIETLSEVLASCAGENPESTLLRANARSIRAYLFVAAGETGLAHADLEVAAAEWKPIPLDTKGDFQGFATFCILTSRRILAAAGKLVSEADRKKLLREAATHLEAALVTPVCNSKSAGEFRTAPLEMLARIYRVLGDTKRAATMEQRRARLG